MPDKPASRTFDIAIVGGGIAGPALAAALADSGYSIVLIERSADPLDTVRGDQLQPATVELLDNWGVLDRLLSAGAERRLGSKWYTAEGELLLETRVDNLPVPHPYFLFLDHEKISEVLLQRASDNPSFSFLRPAKAHINQKKSGQHSLTVTKSSGEKLEADANCIAIADGRNSTSRKILGIDSENYKYQNPLLILFAPRNQPDERNDLQAYFTSSGIVSFVPRNGDNWKIGLPIAPSDLKNWKSASRIEISERIAKLTSAPGELDAHIAGVYPITMMTASRWSDGNCVLIGDACHALHPGRSQGMNVAFAGVEKLAKQLLATDIRQSKASVRQLLNDFESANRPATLERLEQNHQRGLEMDSQDSDVGERAKASLLKLREAPEKLHQYCMHAAGY